MKKNMKKAAAALTLSAVMAAGLLTGCGSSGNTASTGGSQSTGSTGTGTTTTGGIDLSEHVDLTMYLLGDRSADFDEVYGEINKILEDKLNCSINVEFLSWGEHDTKYSLLFSGGARQRLTERFTWYPTIRTSLVRTYWLSEAI